MREFKITKNNLFNAIFYILFFTIYVLSLTFYSMGEEGSKIRYYILLVACIMGFLMMIKTKKIKYPKKLSGKKLLYSLGIGIIFLILSIYKAKEVNMQLNMRTYVQIALVVLPAIYAFFILNLFETEHLINLLKITTFILIIGYFMEKGHHITDFFNINNWLNISISSSRSFTESSLYSEPFLQLFIFFNFAKHLYKEDKKIKNIGIYYYISLIFTILAFKRLALAFVLFILVINIFLNKSKETKINFGIIVGILFTIITIYYTKFMQGDLFKNVDVYNLTTGRDYILGLWTKKDYFSYGYGTSMLVIGRYLEMDLIQIYKELGITALLLFNLFFGSLVKKNKYCLLVLMYELANMLTASILPSLISTFICYLTITFISEKKYEMDGYMYKSKKGDKEVGCK